MRTLFLVLKTIVVAVCILLSPLILGVGSAVLFFVVLHFTIGYAPLEWIEDMAFLVSDDPVRDLKIVMFTALITQCVLSCLEIRRAARTKHSAQ